MKDVLTKRVWASVALLSIIVPVGLLATFRLTGVLREPSKPEVMTVETVTWNMSRPSRIVTIDKRVENSYSNNVVSVSFDVHVAEYWEEKLGWYPSDGDDDVLYLSIIGSVNISTDFIHSMIIRFADVDANAILYIDQDSPSRKLNNLQLGLTSWSNRYKDGAYVEAVGINGPRNASLSIVAYWVFSDQNNTDHLMTTSLEVTYFDGTSYQEVILPILTGVLVH